MSEVREIVTRAVLAKGRKTFRLTGVVEVENTPYSVLGCWVINHDFIASQENKQVKIEGQFEIDVWYSFNNNTETAVAKSTVTYEGCIKLREIVCDTITDNPDVVVRILQQPTCINACINDGNIEVEVVFDALAELIGETKMMVNVYCGNDTFDAVDNFENEINEDFINEN